jgi:hypothetical protein
MIDDDDQKEDQLVMQKHFPGKLVIPVITVVRRLLLTFRYFRVIN